MKKTISVALAAIMMTGAASAATTVLTMTDQLPGRATDPTGSTITGGASITDPSPGNNTSPYSQMVYSVTTAGGGTFDVTIDATATATAGGVLQATPTTRLNGFGNWSVNGGQSDNQIDSTAVDTFESLTLTVSVGNYGGGFTASDVQLDGFKVIRYGGHGSDDQGTIDHGGSQISLTSADDYNVTGNVITNTASYNVAKTSNSTYNVQGYDIQFTVTAVPEPSSAALLGLGGLALILRRRK